MKNLELLKTQIDLIISDNKEYIRSYTEQGNVLKYLHNDFSENENGHHLYLTDEEIQFWGNACQDDRVYLINEIEDFLKQYDYNLLTINNLISLYKRNCDNDLLAIYHFEQAFFDDYVSSFCKEGGFVESELSLEQLKEIAYNFLEE